MGGMVGAQRGWSGMGSLRPAHLWSRAVTSLAIAGALALVPAGAATGSGPQNLTFSVSGANGVGSIVNPGLPCASGGQGNYRDFTVSAPLPGGVLSNLAGDLRASLDVQHDGVEPPVGPVTTNAFLLGSASHVTLSNQRGTVQLALTSGTCAKPTLPFDGTTIGPATVTWAIDPASTGNTGSYRNATGSGTLLLQAALGPGADNPWSMAVGAGQGKIAVLQPALGISVVNTFWGNLGLDYALRNVSVTYRITNSGPGDAFGVVLASTSSPTNGVTPLGPTPQTLGDLASGASTTVTVAYHLDLLAPCALVVLSCKFDSKLTATMPDALDVPSTQTATAPITAPNLPPPL